MPPWIAHPVYWHLVQQLMDEGWYRLGPGPAQEDGRLTWGFREGHVLDARREQPLWILADDELTAMRLLVSELQHRHRWRAGRVPATAHGQARAS
jgi:hypothetical protein